MPVMICPRCEYFGQPAKKARGSQGLAVMAWMVFPFGLPYTIWRMATKIPVCKQCGNRNVIDAESPAGMHLLDKVLKMETAANNKARSTPMRTDQKTHDAVITATQPASPLADLPPPTSPKIKRPQNPNEW